MGMEDGPASQEPAQVNSQLYMYVGEKEPQQERHRPRAQRAHRRHPLRVPLGEPGPQQRVEFLNGTIEGEWVSLGNVTNLTESSSRPRATPSTLWASPGPKTAPSTREHGRVLLRHHRGGDRRNALGRLYSLD